jgi:hypothetical protein
MEISDAARYAFARFVSMAIAPSVLVPELANLRVKLTDSFRDQLIEQRMRPQW